MNREALVGMLVRPETVLGWHRELVRREWAAFGCRRGPGRPGLDPEIQTLILQMAKDNPRWARLLHPISRRVIHAGTAGEQRDLERMRFGHRPRHWT